MTQTAPQFQLVRMVEFTKRAREFMIGKGLTEAKRTCPWCNIKDALHMTYGHNGGTFTMTCTGIPDCIKIEDREI